MACYDEILSFYNDKSRSDLSTEIWWQKYIIRLMNNLAEKQSNKNDLEVTNCLILLLNLFVVKDPILQGKSIEELTLDEKSKMLQELRSEFQLA